MPKTGRHGLKGTPTSVLASHEFFVHAIDPLTAPKYLLSRNCMRWFMKRALTAVDLGPCKESVSQSVTLWFIHTDFRCCQSFKDNQSMKPTPDPAHCTSILSGYRSTLDLLLVLWDSEDREKALKAADFGPYLSLFTIVRFSHNILQCAVHPKIAWFCSCTVFTFIFIGHMSVRDSLFVRAVSKMQFSVRLNSLIEVK